MGRKNWFHYLGLAGIVFVGIGLRFANLDGKPLWLDEMITALLVLGKQFQDIPLETIFTFEDLSSLFSLNSDVSCRTISERVTTHSTHPPLFFCGLHQWLFFWEPSTFSLAWKLRSLSAFFGVAAIAAIYFLNCRIFSKNAGLMAAALMAVSPFAVYLSQEARHYTIPIFLVSLTLCASWEMLQDLQSSQSKRWWIWMGWGLLNGIGLYVHYFFILVIVAQIATFVIFWWRQKFDLKSWYISLQIGGFLLFPFLLFLPWMGTLYEHVRSSETNWLQPFDPSWVDSIAPIYQTLLAWFSMTIALPVERQPLGVIIACGSITLLFFGWLVKQAIAAGKIIYRSPQSKIRDGVNFLSIFTIFVLLEFAFIVYGLKTDITVAPRYHFIYYPSICALLGEFLVVRFSQFPEIRNSINLYGETVSKLTQKQGIGSTGKSWLNRVELGIVIPFAVGFLSSILVVQDMVFQKPYYPQEIAQRINQPRNLEMVIFGYKNFQEVALGLSFVKAIQEDFSRSQPLPRFAFFSRSNSYQPIWQELTNLSDIDFPKSSNFAVKVWVIAPGLRQAAYPATLQLGNNYLCSQKSQDYFRLGVPFQGYPCQKPSQPKNSESID